MADLALKPWVLDIGSQYSADEIRQPWEDLVVEGVVGRDDFRVLPKSGTVANPDAGGGARNMTVDILSGAGWIVGDDNPTTQGIYRAMSLSTVNLSIPAAVGATTQSLVLLRAYDAPTNKATLELVTGTAGGGDPAIPNNAVALARVSVATTDTLVQASMITDLRPFALGTQVVAQNSGAVSMTANTWVDIASVTFVLTNPRPIVISGAVKFNSTGAGRPTVAAAVVEGSTVYWAGQGFSMGGTGDAFGQDIVYTIPRRKIYLAAGSHTFKLQGYKDSNGTAQVQSAPGTLGAYSARSTELLIDIC